MRELILLLLESTLAITLVALILVLMTGVIGVVYCEISEFLTNFKR